MFGTYFGSSYYGSSYFGEGQDGVTVIPILSVGFEFALPSNVWFFDIRQIG